jgi:hypothetical protein
MDLSSARKGLIEEMHILSQKPDQIKKLIIVYRNEDVAQKGFEALPGPLKNNCPTYSYGKEMESEYIGEKIKKQIFSTGKYLMPMWLKSPLDFLIFIVFLYEVFQHTKLFIFYYLLSLNTYLIGFVFPVALSVSFCLVFFSPPFIKPLRSVKKEGLFKPHL